MSNHSYYRGQGKPFLAKRAGYCLSCKKPIRVGDKITVLFFTQGKMPFHSDCNAPAGIMEPAGQQTTAALQNSAS
jgi:hypothetical protein